MVKNILILGAGFCGLRTARLLSKRLKDPNYKITIVDKTPDHVFRADLYEVATAFNKEITDQCLTRLANTVATPIDELIDHDKVTFLRDEVTKIDPKGQKIHFKSHKPLPYEYLVLALGSAKNYYDIPGLEKHSFGLKNVDDALAINCHLDQFFHKLYDKKSTRPVSITVGGGGATGVETAAELTTAIINLCKKYHYPSEQVTIQLVEGTSELAALGPRGTAIVLKRLKKLGIKVHLNSFIVQATPTKITIKTGEKTNILRSDITIWTGGVQVSPLITKTFKGPLKVDRHLRTRLSKRIFAGGDNAYFPDPSNPRRPLPMLAQIANDEGSTIAHNLLATIRKRRLIPYHHVPYLYLLPLGRRYAILKYKNFILKGHWLWFLRRLVTLKYALSILPFFTALTRWHHTTKIFMKND